MKIEIGDIVRRKTTEAHYQDMVGKVIEIDKVKARARIQWPTNRTYYKLCSLVLAEVKE